VDWCLLMALGVGKTDNGTETPAKRETGREKKRGGGREQVFKGKNTWSSSLRGGGLNLLVHVK